MIVVVVDDDDGSMDQIEIGNSWIKLACIQSSIMRVSLSVVLLSPSPSNAIIIQSDPPGSKFRLMHEMASFLPLERSFRRMIAASQQQDS